MKDVIKIIITREIVYRGKKQPISVLSKHSNIKVEVKCPKCKEVRSVHYKSICKAGHHFCLKCIRQIKQRKYLNIGDNYGNLAIINPSKKSGFSICRCECGNEVEVYNYNLKIGKTQSCGCLRQENLQNIERPKGENHGMWKGGVSTERERFMQTKEYKDWRISVFERDNFTCQKCGQVGYDLNAHHIKNYADNEDCRTDIDNGTTLCEECHRLFHSTYGIQNNNELQFEEFLDTY